MAAVYPEEANAVKPFLVSLSLPLSRREKGAAPADPLFLCLQVLCPFIAFAQHNA